MHCAAALLSFVVGASGPQLAFVSLFTECEYRYTGGDYQDELFKYRLFVPEAAEPAPLIVWLHGRGEASSDNVHHLRWLDRLIFPKPWEKERFPFYVLAVQCPFENPVWTRAKGSQEGDDMVNVVKAILDRTIEDYPIDHDRIYLTGLSSGGAGCWEMALRYPGYFSAVCANGLGGGDPPRLDRLKEIPVWAFHSTADIGTPVASVCAFYRGAKRPRRHGAPDRNRLDRTRLLVGRVWPISRPRLAAVSTTWGGFAASWKRIAGRAAGRLRRDLAMVASRGSVGRSRGCSRGGLERHP